MEIISGFNSGGISQVIIASTTVNANTTSPDSTVLDLHLTNIKQLNFIIAGTFATTAASTGLKLQIFYSPDGSNWDTEPLIIEPTIAANTTGQGQKQKGRPITPMAGYWKANVVNLDPTNNATAVKVTATVVI